MVQTVRNLRHVRVATLSSVRVIMRLRDDVAMVRTEMGLDMEKVIIMVVASS